MHHVGHGDGFDQIEAVKVFHRVEQALAATEQHRYDVKVHVVDKARVEVLLRGQRAPRQRDVLLTSGSRS